MFKKNSPVTGWGGLSLSNCQVVKKMSSCQKDVKCQKVKYLTYGGGSQKIINWLNEVYIYWCQVWHQIWRSPKLVKNNFYAHFAGFWLPSYVTSKLTSISVNLIMSIFFVNLLHNQDIWFFDNWHIFDKFTSFDILLPHHLCAPLLMGIGVMGHMGNVACALLDLHGSRVMGCMGNRPHEQ